MLIAQKAIFLVLAGTAVWILRYHRYLVIFVLCLTIPRHGIAHSTASTVHLVLCKMAAVGAVLWTQIVNYVFGIIVSLVWRHYKITGRWRAMLWRRSIIGVFRTGELLGRPVDVVWVHADLNALVKSAGNTVDPVTRNMVIKVKFSTYQQKLKYSKSIFSTWVKWTIFRGKATSTY